MSTKQLFDFIGRANTIEKIAIAEQWFIRQKDNLCRADFDCFMQALSEKRKRLILTNIMRLGYTINSESGEIK